MKKPAAKAASTPKKTAPATARAGRGIAPPDHKQQKFVEEYLVDLNATQAAIRAGYSQATARQQGSRLLSKADIQELIAAARAKVSEETGITVGAVIKRMAEIAFADPRELIELHKVPCDGCDNDGRIDPDCEQCDGEGTTRVVPRDTRALSPGAAALYAGVKQTKEGLEIKMHSQLDAAEKLMRHLGGYERDNAQKSTPLADMAVAELLKLRTEVERGRA